MNKRFGLQSNSGISLVAVIITIIVIIILAAISMTGMNAGKDAEYAKYVQEFQELKKGVETKRVVNAQAGNEHVDKGFHQVYVSGDIPYNFMSIGNMGESVAYLVSLDYIGYDDLTTGRDYKRFESLPGEEKKTVKFGVDDVYVYDSKGRVFYAKGFIKDDITHYEPEDDGKIKIVDVQKELAPDTSYMDVEITIESDNDVKRVVILEDNNIKYNTTEDDEIYKVTIDENGKYEILAEDEEGNIDRENLVISGIGSANAPTVTAVVTNGTKDGSVWKLNETTAKLELTSTRGKYLYISESSAAPGDNVWLPFSNNVERYFADTGSKMLYIWVKDENGNVSSRYDLELLIELEIPPTPVPPIQELSGDILFTYIKPTNPAEWSKAKQIKITYSEGRQKDGYTSRFRINGGRWTQSYNTEAILDIATNNTTIEAQITFFSDYQNEVVAESAITVVNIDKYAPIINYFRVDSTGEYLEADAKEDVNVNNVGLHSQAYLITKQYINFKYLTDEQIESYDWTSAKTLELTEDTRYYLYVRDAVNNIATASIIADAPDKNPPEIISISGEAVLDYAIIKTTAKDDTGVVAYGITKEAAPTEPAEWMEIAEQEYVVIQHSDIREETTFTVWVKDHAGNKAYASVDILLNQFPVLDVEHPKDLYIKENTSGEFRIVVETPGRPEEYIPQWQESSDEGITWKNVVGATDDVYSFTAQYKDHNKLYRCWIHHARGEMYSEVARLEVIRITTDKPTAIVEGEKELVLGGVLINKGATTTTNTTLTINVYAVNAKDMCISENGAKGDWITYRDSVSYILKDTSKGTKTITVWVRDEDGNEYASSVSAQITLN